MTKNPRRLIRGAAALATALTVGCGGTSIINATPPGQQVDTFVQQGHGQVDILWVVDDSPSMADKQTNLANNFASFFNQLTSNDIDYHIGVITTDAVDDMGMLKGTPSIITTSTSGGLQDFESTVKLPDTGNPLDEGLEAIRLFFEAPATGFLRTDAYLFIIIISDKDNITVGGADPHYYYRLFSTYKGQGNNGMIDVSAIVGGPMGCFNMTATTEGQPSPNYDDVAQSMGGQVFSVCDNSFANSLTDLGIAAVGLQNTFDLTDKPDLTSPMTVQVSYPCPLTSTETAAVTASCSKTKACAGTPQVEECTVTQLMASDAGTPDGGNTPSESGWTYLPTVNAIIFSGEAIPPKGATITVTYKSASASTQR